MAVIAELRRLLHIIKLKKTEVMAIYKVYYF